MLFGIVSACPGSPASLVRELWSNSILLTSVIGTSCTQGCSVSPLWVGCHDLREDTRNPQGTTRSVLTTDTVQGQLSHLRTATPTSCTFQSSPPVSINSLLTQVQLEMATTSSWDEGAGLTSALTSPAGNLLRCPPVLHLSSGAESPHWQEWDCWHSSGGSTVCVGKRVFLLAYASSQNWLSHACFCKNLCSKVFYWCKDM